MSRRALVASGVRCGLGVLALLLAVAVPAWSAAQQAASKPAAGAPMAEGYVGAAACKDCHQDQFDSFSTTVMGKLFLRHPRTDQERLGCENCHGPGKAHVDAGGGKGVGGLISFGKKDPTPVDRRNAVCLQCHEKTARLYWRGSPHESRGVACTACHTVMTQVSERRALARANVIDTCGQCHLQRRAQTMRSSHMPLREAKMDCATCHNPHGSHGPALLKTNTVNENCYTCHAEKRGPFLWEHAPVVESCSNCHEPHGTNRNEKLLKLSKPRLCHQCHDETGHPTSPQTRGSRFVFNRSCTNCHSQIHGSNHPSGLRWNR